ASPYAATCSRHSPTAGTPAATHPATRSGRGQSRAVAWLNDSLARRAGAVTAAAPRPGGPRGQTAAPLRPAARRAPRPTGPAGTARRARRDRGTAPTAP